MGQALEKCADRPGDSGERPPDATIRPPRASHVRSYPAAGGAATLGRTQTRRTVAATNSLAALRRRVEELEMHVDGLDGPPDTKLLAQAKADLNRLESDIDAVSSMGLSGAVSVRDLRKPLVIRVERMQRHVDSLMGACRGVAPVPSEPAKLHSPSWTPSKQSMSLDKRLDTISTDLDKMEERCGFAMRRCQQALDQHAKGFTSSRSSLVSSDADLRWWLLQLEYRLETSLDALRIDDDAGLEPKKHRRKMLNSRLHELFDTLERGRTELKQQLDAPTPPVTGRALALTSGSASARGGSLPSSPPVVAASPARWSSATVNAVLGQSSLVQSDPELADTTGLAWRSDSGYEEEAQPPRQHAHEDVFTADHRRLTGLFALDPSSFRPELDFDFTSLREEDEEPHLRGGRPYYRPVIPRGDRTGGWKRFALDVNTKLDAETSRSVPKYGLDECTNQELMMFLNETESSSGGSGDGSGSGKYRGCERSQLISMARELGLETVASERWLGDEGEVGIGEWCNAFHGTSAVAASKITEAGLRRGSSTASADGGVTRQHGATFGPGIYVTPRVEEASVYCEPVEVTAIDEHGVAARKYYQVVFQCRVRGPGFASHAEAVRGKSFFDVGLSTEAGADSWAKDYWVVPRLQDVRPYAVLMQEC